MSQVPQWSRSREVSMQTVPQSWLGARQQSPPTQGALAQSVAQLPQWVLSV